MDLGEGLPPYQKAFKQKRTKYDKSSSSTDKPDPESTDEPKGKRGRPPKPKETIIPTISKTLTYLSGCCVGVCDNPISCLGVPFGCLGFGVTISAIFPVGRPFGRH